MTESGPASPSWFAAELTKATHGGEVNLFGEPMDDEGMCHCGVPGGRYVGKKGFWCGECAFAVHDTCECSSSSSSGADSTAGDRGDEQRA